MSPFADADRCFRSVAIGTAGSTRYNPEMRFVERFPISCYAATGGLLTLSEAGRRLQMPLHRVRSLLHRWTAAKRVLLVAWRGDEFLPAFQINAETRLPRAPVEAILREFEGVFDDAEAAAWFVTPNAWIAGWMPSALMAQDPRAALGAARADRYVALG